MLALTTVVVFIVLSLVFIVVSDAPFKVHAVDISALFIAFVIPSLVINAVKEKQQLYILLFCAVAGLLFWDILTAYIIVKRDVFMGWYVFYPVGFLVLFMLHILVKYLNKKFIRRK